MEPFSPFNTYAAAAPVLPTRALLASPVAESVHKSSPELDCSLNTSMDGTDGYYYSGSTPICPDSAAGAYYNHYQQSQYVNDLDGYYGHDDNFPNREPYRKTNKSVSVPSRMPVPQHTTQQSYRRPTAHTMPYSDQQEWKKIALLCHKIRMSAKAEIGDEALIRNIDILEETLQRLIGDTSSAAPGDMVDAHGTATPTIECNDHNEYSLQEDLLMSSYDDLSHVPLTEYDSPLGVGDLSASDEMYLQEQQGFKDGSHYQRHDYHHVSNAHSASPPIPYVPYLDAEKAVAAGVVRFTHRQQMSASQYNGSNMSSGRHTPPNHHPSSGGNYHMSRSHEQLPCGNSGGCAMVDTSRDSPPPPPPPPPPTHNYSTAPRHQQPSQPHSHLQSSDSHQQQQHQHHHSHHHHSTSAPMIPSTISSPTEPPQSPFIPTAPPSTAGAEQQPALPTVLKRSRSIDSAPSSPAMVSRSDRNAANRNSSNNNGSNSAVTQRRRRRKDDQHPCEHCHTTITPEWRRGPNGVRTLCNACGLKHAKKLRKEARAGNQTNNASSSSPTSTTTSSSTTATTAKTSEQFPNPEDN